MIKTLFQPNTWHCLGHSWPVEEVGEFWRANPAWCSTTIFFVRQRAHFLRPSKKREKTPEDFIFLFQLLTLLRKREIRRRREKVASSRGRRSVSSGSRLRNRIPRRSFAPVATVCVASWPRVVDPRTKPTGWVNKTIRTMGRAMGRRHPTPRQRQSIKHSFWKRLAIRIWKPKRYMCARDQIMSRRGYKGRMETRTKSRVSWINPFARRLQLSIRTIQTTTRVRHRAS